MVKEIPLQNGMVALVDDEDYVRLKDYQWFENKGRIRRKKEDGTVVELKNEILGNIDLTVLFQDKNKFNFQKTNLELVKHQKATFGSRGHKYSTSKYKGVFWNKQKNKWQSRISKNGKEKHIGFFDDEILAAKAYDSFAIELFGEYAFLNFGNKNSNTNKKKGGKAIQHRTVSRCGFKGVRKKFYKYESYIYKNGKALYIGMFNTPEEAAKAYDQKAFKLYGNKAILNFPEFKSEYERALKKANPMKIKPVPISLIAKAMAKAVASRQK